MEKEQILKLTATYLKILGKLSEFRILEKPSVDLLVENKYLKQKLYRDIKESSFPWKSKNSLVDYLGWISTAYMIDLLKPYMKPDATLTEWALAFIGNYDRFKEHTRNVLRFYGTHDRSVEFMKHEISGKPLDSKVLIGYDDFDIMKDFLEMAGVFGKFIELVIYEELEGKRHDHHDELVEFIKEKAR